MDTSDTKSGASPAVSTEISGDGDLNTATDHVLSLLGEPEDDENPAEPADDAENADEASAEAGEEPAGDADEAGEDEQAADEPDPGTKEPSYTVKVDGEEFTVPLSELISGYQRQADYTRKTSSLAEERRKLADDAKAKAEAHAQEVGRLAQFAQLVMASDPVLAEAQSIDWAKLAQDDPIAYTQKSGAVQQRMAAIQAIMAEHQRVSEERNRSRLAEEMEKATKVIPELGSDDAEKVKATKTAFRKYLNDTGFNDQEIAGIADHRILVVVNDAMQYRKLLAEKKAAEAKKVAAAPKIVKPNSAARSEGGAKTLDAKSKKALRGMPLDAQANVIASLL